MNILDLVMERGCRMVKASGAKGGEWHGPCPACGGDDRFHVWPEQETMDGRRGTYWCRQCQIAGDAEQLLMDLDGLSFPEACAKTGRSCEGGRPARTPRAPRRAARQAWEPISHAAPPAAWQDRAWKLVAWAHRRLMNSPEQLAYLASRGIAAETAERFRLGWNPGQDGRDIFRSRESWGLPTELKPDGKPRRLWIPRGLVIPLVRGDTIMRIRIRRPDAARKYIVLPGSSNATWLLRPDAQAHFVVEAELDAILLDQAAGDLAGAVALGSLEIKPDADASAVLGRDMAVLDALDFEPGNQAGVRARAWWRDRFNAARAPMPEGKDPGEAFQAGVDLRAWVWGWLPPALTVGRTFGPSLSGQVPGGGGVLEAAPGPGGNGAEATGRPEWAQVDRDVARRFPGLADVLADASLPEKERRALAGLCRAITRYPLRAVVYKGGGGGIDFTNAEWRLAHEDAWGQAVDDFWEACDLLEARWPKSLTKRGDR